MVEFLVNIMEWSGRQTSRAWGKPGGIPRFGSFCRTLPLQSKYDDTLVGCSTSPQRPERRQYRTVVCNEVRSGFACLGTVLLYSIVLLAVPLIYCHPANALPEFDCEHGMPCSSAHEAWPMLNLFNLDGTPMVSFADLLKPEDGSESIHETKVIVAAKRVRNINSRSGTTP